MPNGAVTSPNGEVTPQSDSFLGMLLELLKGRWTEREEQTGQPMGIQNVAALSALEFLKPPQKMVPTKNPKLLKMGLKEEMNPAYLEMIAMGTMGKPKGVSGPKTPAIKQTSIKDIIQEGIDEYPSTDAADSHVSKLMQYIRSGEKLPPIVVSPSKYLSDGRHRLEAYRRLGYKKVPTVEGYHVGTSSVTTKSGKKIPLEKVSVEGQEFLRKVKLGGKFYHGGAEKLALKKGMTFHAGTKEAALERIGRYSQRNQPRAVYEVEIKPKKPYLKKGHILDERIPEDRTELYYLQNLPHKRDELAKLGHDVVPYINATEDVGSLSMMVLKRGSARMTGKMERGKTTHAGKWKPSAPTPVKFKMAEDFEYSGNWVGTVGGKEHKIWRETQTGGDTIQGWWYDEAGSFLGMTKKEAIEKLQSMAAGLGGR